jgi:AraC family transcriptional regulator
MRSLWLYRKSGNNYSVLKYNRQAEGGDMMEYEPMIQSVLDVIDNRITENIRDGELARAAKYSVYHFRRVFIEMTGTPVMNYVTRRKLEYALYDLSQGKRIIDVAMDYGFETHAGFTKAFKKVFGYPPSLYRLHISAFPPAKPTINSVKLKHGGIIMQVKIKELKPFTIAGVVSRHLLPNVKRSADIPAYWNIISMDYGKHLSRLYDAFTPAIHGEYGLCFDVDEAAGEFSYILGVAFDKGADRAKIEPDMRTVDMPGGLYAVFTTPEVPDEQYPKSIADTWTEILTHWLPNSQFEYDETRLDYEAYDERDHGDVVQMDICVPLRKRK